MLLRDTTWWQPVSIEQAASPLSQARIEGSSSAAFWGLFAYSFILLVAPQQIFPPLAHFRPAMLAIAVTIPAYVLAKLRARQPIFPRSPGVILGLWLAGWSVLLVPFSLWPGGTYQFLSSLFFKSLTVFFMLVYAIDSVDKLKKVLWLLVAFSVLVAVTTVKHYFHGVAVDNRVEGYVSPLTQNPNDLALTLNLILPMCISLLVLSRGKLIRLVLAGVICGNVLAIILSFSRGGFLTLCMIGAAYFFMIGRAAIKYALPLIVLCAVAVMPFVPASYLTRLETITHYQNDPTGSAQQRAEDMRVAAGIVAHSPIIGTGAGLDWLALNQAKSKDDWRHVHNVYLELSVDLGLPGLCLYLALVYQALKAARRASKAPGDLGQMATGMRISLSAFVLAAMFYPDAYSYYFYYFAGLAFAANRILGVQGEKNDTVALSPARTW